MNELLIGIVGKPNVGKSTFFNAATLSSVPVASHPFTTINPNIGVAYVRKKCVCKEFGVKDNPLNSYCIEGNRFIPFKIVDTAGLVPGAWMGRGLGNQFLDKISRANALIQIVDATGATDDHGNIVKPGLFDPLNDILFLEEELARWFFGIIKRDWDRIVTRCETRRELLYNVIYEKLCGLNFSISQIKETVEKIGKERAKFWTEEDLLNFVRALIKRARPMIIVANKAESDYAEENVKRLKDEGYDVIPASSLSEWILRKAADKGLISYIPGDRDFKILKPEDLTKEQKNALNKIRELVLDRWGNTGVQQALNHIVFDILKWIVVYPVKDPDKLTDAHGNVLPHAFLMPPNSSGRDLAEKIHSEIARGMSHLIDVRKKVRRSADYILKDNDVLSIILR
ncbi:redox-regulated ATPase YchF [Candidatus Geothermarchaeota archaeon]|nr:MAG: redox-regulated ATPase YchF [Candidatus Geothermarchaeota archaeon]